MVVVFTGVFLGAVAAMAMWAAFGTGAATAAALSVPAGPLPTTSVSGSDVTVTWTQVNLAGVPLGSLPEGGYRVARYDTSGQAQTVLTACAGLVTGTATTLECVERGVPTGAWTYGITPRIANWTGTEGTRAPAVVAPQVAASSITFPAASAYRTATWDSGCGTPEGDICGTATPGVTSVHLSIRRGTGNYWNGTSFDSSSEVFVPASGTTAWSLAFPSSGFSPVNGPYTVRSRATAGLLVETPGPGVTFTFDTVAPLSSSTATPAANGAGWHRTDARVDISATDGTSGVKEIDVSSTGAQATATATVPGSSASITITTEGSTTVLHGARDNAGNVESPAKSRLVRIDRTNPTGSITSPPDGGGVRDTVPVSSSDAADTGSGVASVQFQRTTHGGTTWSNIGSAVTSAPYTVTWHTDSLSNGSRHDLRAIITDAAGNTSTSAVVTVTVDEDDPSGSITAPTNNAHVSGTITVASANVTDPGPSASGIASVQFQYRPNGGSSWTNIGAPVTSPPYETAWDTSGLLNGAEYDVRMIATDRAGNALTSQEMTVTVWTIRPQPTTLELKNRSSGGTAGRIEGGDQIVVTYSQALDLDSICQGWDEEGGTSAMWGNGDVQVNIVDGGNASTSDTISVALAPGKTNCGDGNPIRFGTISVASDYVTGGNVTFAGSGNNNRSRLVWNSSIRTITITLGNAATPTSGATLGTVTTATVATYTPDPAIANPGGLLVTGTVSGTARHF